MINTDYLKYLFHKNKRYLLLLILISFLIILFPLRNDFSSSDNAKDLLMLLFVLSMTTGYVIAYISGIKEFNFLMNKKSCSLYFSLPVKRETLFFTTFVYTLLNSLIPVLLNYLVGCCIVFVKYGLDSHALLYLFYLVFFMSVTVMITVFAVLLTNNTLDSVFISGSYFALPVVFMVCSMIYAENISYAISLGSGSYTSELYTGIYYMISPIYASVGAFAIESVNLIIIGWWLIVLGILFIACTRLFNKRKSEDAQETSKSLLGYPLLINILIISLALVIHSFNANMMEMCLYYIILLSINIVMYCVMVRRITFNPKILINFAAIVFFCFVFSTAYTSTDGFGHMKEMMDYDEYIQWHVDTIYVEDNGNIEDEAYYSDDTTCSVALKTLQEDLIEISPDKTGSNTITISIQTNAVNTEDRQYSFREDQMEEVNNAFKQFLKNIDGKDYKHQIYTE